MDIKYRVVLLKLLCGKICSEIKNSLTKCVFGNSNYSAMLSKIHSYRLFFSYWEAADIIPPSKLETILR